MSKLPKLKVEIPFVQTQKNKLLDLEQAKNFLYSSKDSQASVFVEGQAIYSYEELVRLANQDCHKDKEFLTVKLAAFVLGAG